MRGVALKVQVKRGALLYFPPEETLVSLLTVPSLLVEIWSATVEVSPLGRAPLLSLKYVN